MTLVPRTENEMFPRGKAYIKETVLMTVSFLMTVDQSCQHGYFLLIKVHKYPRTRTSANIVNRYGKPFQQKYMKEYLKEGGYREVEGKSILDTVD